MSKTVKWILISLVLLIAVLVGLKAAGVFGKDEGTKVTAEKVQKRTIIEIVKVKSGCKRRNNRTECTGRRYSKKRTDSSPYLC